MRFELEVAAGHGAGAPGQRVADQLGHPIELRLVVDRPELGAFLHAVADHDATCALGQCVDVLGVPGLGDVHALDGGADLAVVGESPPEELVGDVRRLDVVEHDGRVVAAELEGNPLQVGGGRRGDDV